MKIDAEAIRQLAALLDETGLTEIEVGHGDRMIRVNRAMAVSSAHSRPVAGGVAQPFMPSDPATPQAANIAAPDTVAATHPGAVVSPMVGTVYLSSEPGKPPFVQKGDSVKPGDTILIIEAMKVMNPIKADRAGTVSQLLVANGQPVEFGEVLAVIE